jgi:N-acetylglucosamine-6-phosphate deacetylase
MMNEQKQEWIARHYLHGGTVKVTAENGVITAIEQLDSSDVSLRISPGLIDAQLNGIQGVDFNDPETTPEQILLAVRYLHSRGVVHFCPTVVTSDEKGMSECIRTIALACEKYKEVEYSILGIHVEGPYISAEDGPRGAHPRECVRDPDWNEFTYWQHLSGNRICMLTLAPEREGAIEFIRCLASHGVVAAIGHTNATEEQIMRAVEAGATMSTHLGNGAHPVIPRHPNYIWSQLAEDKLWAGLIADGHHLPASTLKAMIRAKGEKAILVSDANHFEGFPPGRYLKRKRHEVILESTGRLVMADNPSIFSGAATPLSKCVENAALFGICSLGEAIRMASERPAQMLGVSGNGTGSLAVGAPADLLLYESDPANKLHIRCTVSQGHVVYQDPMLQI